ncbi:MAG: nuclear transport factor 2 family protein [Thermoanaerobaculia bacterium]
MKSLGILLVALLPLACASTRPTGDATPVRAAMDGFMEALNALDADRMAVYFADDITAFVPLAQGERVNGKAAVVEIFRRYCETTKKTTARTNIVPEDLTIDRNGDIAIVTFNVRSPDSVLRRTFVFRRGGGRWRIMHFHASNFHLAPK